MGWDVEGDNSEIDLDVVVDAGEDEEHSRTLGPASHQPTQPEDHRALVLIHKLEKEKINTKV